MEDIERLREQLREVDAELGPKPRRDAPPPVPEKRVDPSQFGIYEKQLSSSLQRRLGDRRSGAPVQSSDARGLMSDRPFASDRRDGDRERRRSQYNDGPNSYAPIGGRYGEREGRRRSRSPPPARHADRRGVSHTNNNMDMSKRVSSVVMRVHDDDESTTVEGATTAEGASKDEDDAKKAARSTREAKREEGETSMDREKRLERGRAAAPGDSRRNRRMLGMLMGTLTQARDEAKTVTETVQRRNSMAEKAQERIREEDASAARHRRDLIAKRRETVAKLKALQATEQLRTLHGVWQTHRATLASSEMYIRLADEPRIFYAPKTHNAYTLRLARESSSTLKKEHALKSAEEERLLGEQVEAAQNLVLTNDDGEEGEGGEEQGTTGKRRRDDDDDDEEEEEEEEMDVRKKARTTTTTTVAAAAAADADDNNDDDDEADVVANNEPKDHVN